MATAENNRVKIEKLEDDIKNLTISKKKLPAKPPNIYKQSDGSFRKYALQLENYFKIMGVENDNRSNVLLTFLSPEDFESCTRIYNIDQLKSDSFDKTVNHIAKVLDETMTEAASMAKLLNTKQGNMSMQQFLKKLEGYAIQSFPEITMAAARDRCLISALTTNCRSKSLSFQIYTFVNSKIDGSKPSFNEIAMKAIELDSILGAYEDNEENFDKGSGINVLNIKADKTSTKNTNLCSQCQKYNNQGTMTPENEMHSVNLINKTGNKITDSMCRNDGDPAQETNFSWN